MASFNIVPAVRLEPLDQIAPRIYVRSVFIFDLYQGFDTVTALNHMQQRLHCSLKRWPFLAGEIRPAIYGRVNELELSYDIDDKSVDPAFRPDIFRYEVCDRLGNRNYQELKELGMPPSAMDKDVLSLSPIHPRPGESCPPVTVKITELTDGGLFVCFSTHHSIFDGGFVKTFLEYFGKENEESPMDSYWKDYYNRPNMGPYIATNIENAVFPEYDFSVDNELVAGLESLALSSLPSNSSAKAPKHRVVCVLFRFNNTTLRTVHGRALAHVRDRHGPQAFVSMIDTLSAMVWVHVTRARLHRLSPLDNTAFTTAADARPRLSPAFPADSWGNIYTQTRASTDVKALVQARDGVPQDAVPAILDAAWLVRQAVHQVNAPEYIPQRIALAAALPDPTMEGIAFKKALKPDHAGLGCSVWTHMGADVDFRIPGTRGKADYVRKTWSANDGSMNIMQRRGVTKGNAPWEVLLALREDDMERILGGNELGRWVESWCV